MAYYEDILRAISPWAVPKPTESMKSLPPVEVVADREYDFSTPDYSPYIPQFDGIPFPSSPAAPDMAAMNERLYPGITFDQPDVSPYLAQATATDTSASPAPVGTPIQKAMGPAKAAAPYNDKFTQMLLAAGSGMLSAPGAKGLGAGAANVNELMSQFQKRDDDAALRQAKVAKLQADILKGAKTTSDGMGGVWVTPVDGTPPYRLTDAEAREAKIGSQNAQASLANAKRDQVRNALENPDKIKNVQKIGSTLVITKKDGTVSTFTNDEMKAAYGDEYEKKMSLFQEQFKFKENNRSLSRGEQQDLRELDEAIGEASSLKSRFTSTKARLLDPAISEGYRWAASAIPGGQAIAEAMGIPEAEVNQMIEDLKVGEWLRRTALLKGAISNQENERLSKPMPTRFASKETLVKWIKQREQDMEKMMTGLNKRKETDYRTNPHASRGSDNVVPKGSSEAAPVPSGSTSRSPAPVAVPGLSEDATRYLDD